MALALYEYFKNANVNAELKVQKNYVHAYAEANGVIYDYTGEIINPPPCDTLSINDFFERASTHGFTKDEVKADAVIAAEMISACKETLHESAGETTMVLWHGGRNLQSDYQEIRSHKKGRWEHGPGIYLTDHRDTAAKYAKGGGNVFRVTITFDPSKEMDDVIIDIDDAIEFVKRNVAVRLRGKIIQDLHNSFDRTGALRAAVVTNLCLNWDALAPSKTEALRRFLIDSGVEYAKVIRYGGRDETLYVVINPKIIRKVEIVRANNKLNEGLIKFPQTMFDNAMRIIAREVLSWAASKGTRDKFAEQELSNLAKHYGCSIKPAYADIITDPIRAFRINLVDLEGYPKPIKDDMIVAINWKEGLSVRGQWQKKHSALIVMPFTTRILSQWPKQPFAVADTLEELEATVRHEMRHAIQFLYLGDHPDQSKTKYSVARNDDNYYSSPVEFDPTIGSEVDEFLMYYKTLDGYGKKPSKEKLSKMIKQVTGVEKGTISLPTSGFFKSLKTIAPVRYRRAVKKFTYEVMKAVKEYDQI